MLKLTYTSTDESILPSGSQQFETYYELKQWIQYDENGKYLDIVELSGKGSDNSTYELFRGYNSYYGTCCRARKLIFTNWDCSNVVDMSYMCMENTYLTEIVDFNNRNFSKLQTLESFCSNCTNLINFNFSNVYAPELTSMYFMTSSCTKLTKLQFDHITAPKLNDISGISYNSNNSNVSIEVDLSYLKTNANLSIASSISSYKWLRNTTKYTLDYAELPNTTILGFYNSTKLETINIRNAILNPSLKIYITYNNVITDSQLKLSGSGPEISGINIDNCNNITSFDYSNITTNLIPESIFYFTNCSKIKEIKDTNGIVKDTNLTTDPFRVENCSNLEIVSFPNLDLTIQGVYTRFSSIPKLKTIDFNSITFISEGYYSYFMNRTFYNLPELISLPEIRIKYNNSINYNYNMFSEGFSGCSKLTEINLKFIDIPKDAILYCGTFDSMFYNCSSLQRINILNNEDRIYIATGALSSAFYGCSSLVEFPTFIQLYKFTSGSSQYAVSLGDAFNGCSSFTYADLDRVLGAFNYTISSYYSMFQNCSNLVTIMCKRTFPTNLTPSYMANVFAGCSKLVGAISYNPSKVDGNYANPRTGYFTRPPSSLTFYINGQECNELYVNGVQCEQLFINGIEIG